MKKTADDLLLEYLAAEIILAYILENEKAKSCHVMEALENIDTLWHQLLKACRREEGVLCHI